MKLIKRRYQGSLEMRNGARVRITQDYSGYKAGSIRNVSKGLNSAFVYLPGLHDRVVISSNESSHDDWYWFPTKYLEVIG